MCTVLLPSGVNPITVNKRVTNITTSGNKLVDRIGVTNNGTSDNAVSHVRVCAHFHLFENHSHREQHRLFYIMLNVHHVMILCK